MKIGIDVQSIFGQKTGFGVYTKNLIKNLLKLERRDQFISFSWKGKKDLSTPSRWIWDQIILPAKARAKKLDLLHKPCFSPPVFYKGKIVVTVHDLIPLIFPSNFSFPARLYWTRWLPFSLKKVDKIITISESTKRDLIQILQIPSEKIEVIYEGPSFTPTKVEASFIKKIQKKYKLPKKFILTISTLEPRKNLPFLVEVFWYSKKKYRFKEKLVIGGKLGWGLKDFFQKIQSKNLEKEIILLGYVAEEDLPGLYFLASIFVFPSLYEGFGLPVLDALNMGCPTIASNTSSLPEIVGEAGILIDPSEIKAWSNALGKLILDKKMQSKLREKGPKQAKNFSWEKCAKETLEVYEEVVKGVLK